MAVVAVLVAADSFASLGRIHDGVEAGSVPLGGKTSEEARRILEERIPGSLEEVRFAGGPGGEEEFVLSAEAMGVDFDAAATAEEAYSVGRRGGLGERLADRLKATLGTVRVPIRAEYRPEEARDRLGELARGVNEAPRPGRVRIVGGQVEVDEAKRGYELDVAATMRDLERAVQNPGRKVEIAGETLEPGISTRAAEAAAEKARRALSEPLVLTAEGRDWSLPPAEVGRALEVAPKGGELWVGLDEKRLRAALSGVFAALAVAPAEASFVANGSGVAVREGREGKGVDEERLVGEIAAGIFEGRREYEVPLVVTRPVLTTAEAERLKPTALLGRYRTDYTISGDDSPERVENLKIASGAIDGTLLAPGEVFSANEFLAPLDYNPTKVFLNGKVDYADGGGLCQVASTLYMATNYAGLDVIERHPHSAELPYIRPGLDATLWFGDENGAGALDMKFENTSDAYVLIREYVGDDGYVYAEVWGRPSGKEVKMYSEQVALGPDSSTWVTYQTVKEDGEVLFDGVLHRDNYQGIVGVDGQTVPPSEVPTAPVNP
jgi:vancomycin resistance protein YoaR